MSRRFSAQRLRTFVKEVELPARLRVWPVAEAEKISRYGAFVGSVLEHYSTAERTMQQARSLIAGLEEQSIPVTSGTTIIADRVTGSKGRFTRSWHAPAGGLWGTLIYVNTLLPQSKLLLPLTAGIACCEAIGEHVGASASIRWINDVLIEGRKAAGFLTESLTGTHSKEEYCLLGFGINVNNHRFPDELEQTATAITMHVDWPLDLESFCYSFLAKLSWNIGLLHYQEALILRGAGDGEELPHPLVSRYRELCDAIGRQVVFGFDVETEPQFTAFVSGIGEDGGLQLVLDDGTELTEYSGEIRYLS